MYVRTTSHKDICLTREMLCGHSEDIVPTLCGHISQGIYVCTMSALYPSSGFSSGMCNKRSDIWTPHLAKNLLVPCGPKVVLYTNIFIYLAWLIIRYFFKPLNSQNLSCKRWMYIYYHWSWSSYKQHFPECFRLHAINQNDMNIYIYATTNDDPHIRWITDNAYRFAGR